LKTLKNKYVAIIYDGCINNEPIRKIKKKLANLGVKDKVLFAYALKLTNRMKKISESNKSLLAIALIDYLVRENTNEAMNKIINHTVEKQAEEEKIIKINEFIEKSRDKDEWYYLASSHSDCAKDHLAYQGRLYIDEKAPQEEMDYAKSLGLYTIQWVMGEPAWFITRPNCRHYFLTLPLEKVRGKTDRQLTEQFKTHSLEGDRSFQTPKTEAIDKYKDRLKFYSAMYREFPTVKLKILITKTRLLLEKWENYSYNKNDKGV